MSSKRNDEQKPLTARQLEIVAHLANGHRLEDIQGLMHFSRTALNDALRRARRRTGARTNPHLVSLTIARGQLEWNPEDEVRYANGNNGDKAEEAGLAPAHPTPSSPASASIDSAGS